MSDRVWDQPSANPRLDWAAVMPAARQAMQGLEKAVADAGLEAALLELVKIRVSQINGCAYCLDMHTKNARVAGEREQRLYALAAWREAPFFTPRERAALAWAEALTLLPQGVPDALWQAVRATFTDQEIVALTMACIAINGWNRWNVAFQTPAGSYRPDLAR
ncbi:MAG: carboxymuconolactone decarboxylase family protein [Firmicutes bacterium]|nr:carboxymuconolactone decarboxylase family protein [Bacillota bacterium]